jgi:hypothetical protein
MEVNAHSHNAIYGTRFEPLFSLRAVRRYQNFNELHERKLERHCTMNESLPGGGTPPNPLTLIGRTPPLPVFSKIRAQKTGLKNPGVKTVRLNEET